jgi:pimeloyl-ACP methyl ester carboxylesterase
MNETSSINDQMSPIKEEHVIDTALVTRAAELADTDGEFGLNAARWQGSITIACNDDTWTVQIDGGRAVVGPAVPTTPAGDDAVVHAPAEVWGVLLRDPPPPGYSDAFGAVYSGLTVVPDVVDPARHLAIRRFCELLRFAANDLDPAPVPLSSAAKHGQHDAATGHYVHLEIDGFDNRVYYEEAGEGIGLLCQHTAGSDGRQWRHLLEDERITSRFRVVAYDLPFHGKSLPAAGRAWWAEQYRLTRDQLMQIPTALAAVLGLERPAFIGSSVGGMLALDLARYHAADYRAVVACEGALFLDAGSGTAEEPAPALAEDPALHAASMMSWMGATAPEAYRQETRLHYSQGAPGVFPGDINYFAYDHDLRGQAHLIDTSRCPVFMLTGEYDFVTVPFSEQAAREIPGVRYQSMKGMGHFPMSEDPEAFAGYLLPILDEIAELPG